MFISLRHFKENDQQYTFACTFPVFILFDKMALCVKCLLRTNDNFECPVPFLDSYGPSLYGYTILHKFSFVRDRMIDIQRETTPY